MSGQDINYKEVTNWLNEYHACEDKKKKQQLANMIVLTCLPVVKKVVFSLARRYSDPIEDIVQIGTIGLIRAIHKYNPSYENAKPYLFYTILWEIKHSLRNTALQEGAAYTTIELAIRADKFDIDQIDEDISTNLENRIPKSAKIIEKRHVISLDELQFTDENNLKTFADNVSDDKEDYENELYENKLIIHEAVESLPDKLQEIVKKLYFDGYSQIELARKLKTSQSNISRMQKRAISLLAEFMKKYSETEKKEEE